MKRICSLAILLVFALLLNASALAKETDTVVHNENEEISTYGELSAKYNIHNETLGAKEKLIINYVCEVVKKCYSEYYTIPTITGYITNSKSSDDGLSVEVSVNFTKILIADSAADLPYIQGLKAASSQLSNKEDKIYAKEHISRREKDLNDNYIGVEQTENAKFKLLIPTTLESTKLSASFLANADIYVDDGFGTYIDIDYFVPSTSDEFIQIGKDALDNLLITRRYNAVTSGNSIKSNTSSATDYDRVAARNYARQYTCSLGGQNPSYYNTADYPTYYSSDCANYVSQCIHAGGIDYETDVWAPYTTYWKSVGYSGYGLTDYMVDEGFFFYSSSKSEAFAGSMISWTSYGHIGMVDQNDTVTMTYCAHTNDRLSSSFVYIYDIEFYIPEWDSYAGEWTR